MSYKRSKGTEDYFPEEFAFRQAIIDSFRETAKSFNFQEVSSPAFETLKLLTEKEGEDIVNQIFTLEKRSDEELGLRFDLTVPITRMFIDKQKEIQKPVKWFSIDRMWRYERPQKGRLREFYQISCEIFGSNLGDIELVKLAIALLKNLGLTKDDFVVKINNRQLLENLCLEYVNKEQIPELFRLIDKRSKIDQKDFDKELEEMGISKDFNKIFDLRLSEINGNDEETYLLKKLSLLDCVEVDLSIARGLSYYTNLVFEIYDKQGKYRALCGGGRYDNLVEMFGGQKCPASGFAIGLSTLGLLLKDKEIFSDIDLGPDYFLAFLDDDSREKSRDLIEILRENYSVDFDLTSRNLNNQIKYAKTIKAKNLIVIGADEINSRRIKVKDMETGSEEEKGFDEI